jgi:hypothetical protein
MVNNVNISIIGRTSSGINPVEMRTGVCILSVGVNQSSEGNFAEHSFNGFKLAFDFNV